MASSRSDITAWSNSTGSTHRARKVCSWYGLSKGPKPRVVASEATATVMPAASAVRRGPLSMAIHTSTG